MDTNKKKTQWTEEDIERVAQSARVTDNNIHIPDSYKVPKCYFKKILKRIKELHPDAQVVVERGIFGMKLEWATHNFLHLMGIEEARTADVDLNYPRKWYVCLAYAVVGIIGLIFIK